MPFFHSLNIFLGWRAEFENGSSANFAIFSRGIGNFSTRFRTQVDIFEILIYLKNTLLDEKKFELV